MKKFVCFIIFCVLFVFLAVFFDWIAAFVASPKGKELCELTVSLTDLPAFWTTLLVIAYAVFLYFTIVHFKENLTFGSFFYQTLIVFPASLAALLYIGFLILCLPIALVLMLLLESGETGRLILSFITSGYLTYCFSEKIFPKKQNKETSSLSINTSNNYYGSGSSGGYYGRSGGRSSSRSSGSSGSHSSGAATTISSPNAPVSSTADVDVSIPTPIIEEVKPTESVKQTEPAVVKPEELEEPSLTEETETLETVVTRKEREKDFPDKVKRELYDCKCVVCRARRFDKKGNPEVEAAHIYPKSLNGSDDLRNGIALCKFHHWAFDSGMFSISDDYKVLTDSEYFLLSQFKGIKILLPADKRYAPHKTFLKAHRDLHGF